jgi:hypothetical protein
MAVNENGNLLDDGGNVVVDHVWGNMPMQPNDVRLENGGELLDADLDNHNIAYEGWSGYPLYTPNTAGAEGAGYIVVPSVIGLTTAVAGRTLTDDGLVVTTASAVTNAKGNVTRFNATSATSAVVYVTSASTNYPVGAKVTLLAGTPAGSDPVNLPTYARGTWTVTAATSTTITVSGTGFTVADTTGINETGNIHGVAGTIKTQSVAAGANEVEVGDAVTITPYAAAS